MTTLKTTILAASVLAAGLGVAALPQAGEGAGSAAAGTKDQSRYSARLEEALQLAGALAVDEEVLETITAAARKADRLVTAVDCTGQAWPYLGSACLVGTDGRPSEQSVRTVTVEYRVSENTSVLVRLPSPQIAGR